MFQNWSMPSLVIDEDYLYEIVRFGGYWSTRTFANSYFYQIVPNFLILYFSLVISYFMPLVNSYVLIGQLLLIIGRISS